MATTEQDGPWKELFDDRLPEALAFFRPAVHAEVDWSRDHESLELELRKLLPESRTGTRLADKLVKLYLRDSGDPRYLHIEVQGQRESDFEERVYTYNYRARDRFKQPVACLVILVDDDPSWRPGGYEEGVWDTEVSFRFPAVKLLDWRGRETELEAHENPVALFALASLEAVRTRKDVEERARVKLRLILMLHERKMEGEEVRQFYRYFDWMLRLPEEVEDRIGQELDRLKQEGKMPFVPYLERRGMEKGRLLGRIEEVLETKYGTEGLALGGAFEQFRTSERLQEVLDQVRASTTLDEVRALLGPPANPSDTGA